MSLPESTLEIDLLKAIDDRILVGVSARDWVEAVKLAGKLLAESGVVEERYVEAMVRVTEELGPYAVLAPGVAMPHARPEDGAREVGLSLVVLREGVNFGSPNDPVYVVIGFAAKDKTSHLKVLQQLAEFLSEPGVVEELRKVRSEEELKSLLLWKLRR